MNFYIKEWANNTATLMTDCGKVLWTFPSVDAAYQVCQEYYTTQLQTRRSSAPNGDDDFGPQILIASAAH